MLKFILTLTILLFPIAHARAEISANQTRWHGSWPNCNNLRNLVCMVHP